MLHYQMSGRDYLVPTQLMPAIYCNGFEYRNRQRKPKGQSRIDNPEKLSTLGTQDKDKPNKNTTQKTKKDEQHRPQQIMGSESR